MKILIAILSCERDAVNGTNQAVRDTWLRLLRGAVHRFFVGECSLVLRDDEVRLPVADDYMSLPHKSRAIFRWSLERGYDFVFKCDVDTYVRPVQLLSSGFEEFDLTGCFNGPLGIPGAVEGRYAWVSGGNGYWLSRRAMQLIAANEPDSWAEDLWVGQVAGREFQRGAWLGHDDRRYGDGTITVHRQSDGRSFDPSWLHERHREVTGARA